MALTDHDERVLAVVSLAAERGGRLERVAARVLDRDDAVTALLRAAGDDREAWHQVADVCSRHGGNPFGALDLVVEVSQQDLERRGEARTWTWPGPGVRAVRGN